MFPTTPPPVVKLLIANVSSQEIIPAPLPGTANNGDGNRQVNDYQHQLEVGDARNPAQGIIFQPECTAQEKTHIGVKRICDRPFDSSERTENHCWFIQLRIFWKARILMLSVIHKSPANAA